MMTRIKKAIITTVLAISVMTVSTPVNAMAATTQTSTLSIKDIFSHYSLADLENYASDNGMSYNNRSNPDKGIYCIEMIFQDPRNLKSDKVINKAKENATKGNLDAFFEGADKTAAENENKGILGIIGGGLKNVGKNMLINIGKDAATEAIQVAQDELDGRFKDHCYYYSHYFYSGIEYMIKLIPVENNGDLFDMIDSNYEYQDNGSYLMPNGQIPLYLVANKSFICHRDDGDYYSVFYVSSYCWSDFVNKFNNGGFDSFIGR